MTGTNGPNETGKSRLGTGGQAQTSDDELEHRRRALETTLNSRSSDGRDQKGSANTSGATGYGQAVKLSSEFIAGIAVGAGLGWIIDRLAGTSPFGLIVFLLLGFGAGVLNVMRSVGVVAEAGIRTTKPGDDARD